MGNVGVADSNGARPRRRALRVVPETFGQLRSCPQ